MSDVHICTRDSLRAGCEDIPNFDCSFCGGLKTVSVSWVDTLCSRCGYRSGGYFCEAIYSVRTHLKITRKNMAVLCGIKPNTLKKYEFTNPSKVFYERFKIVVCNLLNERG